MPNDQVDVTAGAPNLESYRDNGDGTVTDNVTGLTWQQTVPTGTYTWAQALAYCPTLTLAGHSDWRLPSRIELVSIVDFGVTSGPMINSTYFPSTPSGSFWSSSPFGSSFEAWSVSGLVGYGDIRNAGNVRCVRSTSVDASAPTDQYVVTNGGTVYDTKTKLTWQQAVPSTTYAWADAKSYCASLSLGGTGWRLPTCKELQTIVDDSRTDNQMIDANAFPSTPGGWFWSLSPSAGPESPAWAVSFASGIPDGDGVVPITCFVRCVR